VLQDGLGGGGAKDDGDDAAPAPAAGAGEDVGLERPPEELGPGDGAAGLPWADGLGCHRAERCLCQRRRGRRCRHDTGPHPGIGGEDNGGGASTYTVTELTRRFDICVVNSQQKPLRISFLQNPSREAMARTAGCAIVV